MKNQMTAALIALMMTAAPAMANQPSNDGATAQPKITVAQRVKAFAKEIVVAPVKGPAMGYTLWMLLNMGDEPKTVGQKLAGCAVGVGCVVIGIAAIPALPFAAAQDPSMVDE